MQWEFKYSGTTVVALNEEEAAALSKTLIAQKIDFEVKAFEPFHNVWTSDDGATLFVKEDDSVALMRKLVKDKIPFEYSIHKE